MTGEPDGSFNMVNTLLPTADYFCVIFCSILMVVFFCFGIVFSYGIGAVEEATVSGIKKQQEKPETRRQKAAAVLDHDSRYLRILRIGFAWNLAAAVLSGEIAFSGFLAQGLYSLVPSVIGVNIAALILLLWLVTVFYAALAGIVPYRFGSDRGDENLIKAAPVLKLLSVITLPAALPGEGLARLIFKMTGKSAPEGSRSAEEEILLMVDEGEESGLIEGNTKDMIENIFDFDDTTVGEIMTHRKDVVAVREDSTIAEAVSIAMDSGKSRLPVYREDMDDITGILYVKDMLRYVGTSLPKEPLDGSMLKEAVFVPQSKSCSEMFEYMTKHKTQIAVVVDEFGGTGGIITMEDLVESIVGSIQDEYDNEDEEIKRLDEYSFTVDGAAPLDELEELTGLALENDESDTIAGLMLDKMGHIPKHGEHPSVMINGTRFTVQEVDGQRISKVLVVKGHKKDKET